MSTKSKNYMGGDVKAPAFPSPRLCFCSDARCRGLGLEAGPVRPLPCPLASGLRRSVGSKRTEGRGRTEAERRADGRSGGAHSSKPYTPTPPRRQRGAAPSPGAVPHAPAHVTTGKSPVPNQEARAALTFGLRGAGRGSPRWSPIPESSWRARGPHLPACAVLAPPPAPAQPPAEP